MLISIRFQNNSTLPRCAGAFIPNERHFQYVGFRATLSMLCLSARVDADPFFNLQKPPKDQSSHHSLSLPSIPPSFPPFAALSEPLLDCIFEVKLSILKGSRHLNAGMHGCGWNIFFKGWSLSVSVEQTLNLIQSADGLPWINTMRAMPCRQHEAIGDAYLFALTYVLVFNLG